LGLLYLGVNILAYFFGRIFYDLDVKNFGQAQDGQKCLFYILSKIHPIQMT